MPKLWWKWRLREFLLCIWPRDFSLMSSLKQKSDDLCWWFESYWLVVVLLVVHQHSVATTGSCIVIKFGDNTHTLVERRRCDRQATPTVTDTTRRSVVAGSHGTVSAVVASAYGDSGITSARRGNRATIFATSSSVLT